MGTLGTYLSDAREAKGVDLHDAAQQTRISIHYLKALEQENFAKLPGEVFVKGFLKNYGKFLNLDESELMKKYEELRAKQHPPSVVPNQAAEQKAASSKREKTRDVPLEPVIWGAGIFIALIIFLFASAPEKGKDGGRAVPAPTAGNRPETVHGQTAMPDKLYLEIVALDDVWLLVRTDSSPQKKAVLKKGEDVIWSADERFLLSYGSVGAVKLTLNGKELAVSGPENAVVRDLIITESGIANPKIQAEQQKAAKPKPQPPAPPAVQPVPAPQPAPVQAPQPLTPEAVMKPPQE